MLQNVTATVWERIVGAVLLVVGWLLGGMAFEPIGPPWNTLFFLGAPLLILCGLYLLVRKKP